MRPRILLITTAVIVLGLASVCVLYAHDLGRARARLAGRSQIVETSLGTVEYAVLGAGEPILAVHGASGGFDQGIDLTGAMTGHGYRIIAPSRFGYLRSSMPAGATTAMQADAYAQLLDHLGIDKVFVVGISAGAWSASQFAIRYPQRCRALVLLVPANYLPPGMSIHGGAIARAILSSDFVAWAALKLMPLAPGGMTRSLLGTDDALVRSSEPSERARIQQVLDHLLPITPRAAGTQFDVRTAATREPYAIQRIVCPVLTISADDDQFHTNDRARYIAATVPDGRDIVFPTGGHALVGHYTDALADVMTFLQRGAGSGPGRARGS